MLRTRLSSSAGQVAAEYLGGLLLVAVVIAALLGGQLHTKIAVEAERAICKITGSAGCGEPGVPTPEGADSDPSEPDREVHDAECDNDLPGRLLRDEGDDPAGGDEEANQVYDNLGQVFEYYSSTFGRNSYDDAGGDLVASINFCETPGTPLRNAY
jgi:Zn-dependent metalloprotease